MTYPSPAGRKAIKVLVKLGVESYTVRLRSRTHSKSALDQCLKNRASFASNSSNDIEPLTLSPLMKNVGVASTFS